MEDLTQTISNLVGILLGVVGAIGVGFFIYGAYLYLTASGAPHQMERGKSAMMTALAGIVLALVAYGVVELVMNAVVDPGIDIDDVLPGTDGTGIGERRREERDMREHEVPTHVQAEDKVLLGFTFPQIVAGVAVCAISYGAYRYAPVGPSEVRMALAVVLGLAGVAMIVGQIGGRRLPLVAADLLRFWLGARRYAGPPAQLTRSEPPAPVQPANSGPGPLRLMVRKARRGLRRPRKKTRKDGERRNGRMRWFGKRRGKDAGNRQRHDHKAETLETAHRKPRRGLLAFAVVGLLAVAVATVPQSALADSHEGGGGWSSDEIEFRPPEPVEGRRLFVERLSVTGDHTAVTLRAATGLELRVRAYGGWQGRSLRFYGAASLDEGERIDYTLPLHGDSPSFTLLVGGHAGTGRGLHRQAREHPPSPARSRGRAVQRQARVPRLDAGSRQRRHRVRVRSAVVEEPVDPQDGGRTRQSVTETALMDAEVTAITGTVSAATGASQAERPVRTQRRDPLPASACESGDGHSRRDHRREPGGRDSASPFPR